LIEEGCKGSCGYQINGGKKMSRSKNPQTTKAVEEGNMAFGCECEADLGGIGERS